MITIEPVAASTYLSGEGEPVLCMPREGGEGKEREGKGGEGRGGKGREGREGEGRRGEGRGGEGRGGREGGGEGRGGREGGGDNQELCIECYHCTLGLCPYLVHLLPPH